MGKTTRYALVLAVCGPILSPALAQQLNDDGGISGVQETSAFAASDLGASEPLVKRYLVTYLKSRTDAPRSATVVTVTNRLNDSCRVRIRWFQGFNPDTPACTTTEVVDSGVTHDFCSRDLLANITTCNSTCDPELTFTEGKAIVSSNQSCSGIGVDSRVYYTNGDTSDTGVAAVSNPQVLRASSPE